MKTLSEQLGQLLIVGVDGNRLDAETEQFLREIHPGGVIFFQRNIGTAAEFRGLVEQVGRVGTITPFLALDLEGGKVDRLREAIAPLPAVRDVARAGLGELMGKLAGRELGSFRLNLDFAPVLDLGTPECEKVMGSRTAGATAEEVVAFAKGFLTGLAESLIVGCGKHFPGLGSGQTDSHLGLPVVEKDAQSMWDEDLKPYRALVKELPMIMIAHVFCPELERAYSRGGSDAAERLPASLSRTIVTELLRKRIGFEGLVVCDDLEMGGVLEGRTQEQAAAAALRAGCDLLLLCGPTENTRKVYAELLREAESDLVLRSLIEQT